MDTSLGVCGHDTHGQPISVRSECTSLVECLAPPCRLTVTATACVATNAPPPTTAGESCTGGAVALTLQYTGATINAPTVVRITGSGGATVTYDLPSLKTGDILTMDTENGFSIDATAHGDSKLGTQTRVDIDSSYEVFHTSCSCTGYPACFMICPQTCAPTLTWWPPSHHSWCPTSGISSWASPRVTTGPPRRGRRARRRSRSCSSSCSSALLSPS